MLIEASRGGHTTVANLLLSQPRDTSPIETPPSSPTGSIQDLLGGSDRLTATIRSSSCAGCGCGGVGKVPDRRADRSEGGGDGDVAVGEFSGDAELPRTVLRRNSSVGDCDISDLGTSKAKRQKVASDNTTMLPSALHSYPYPPFATPTRSKGKQQKPLQGYTSSPVSGKSPHGANALQYATDSAMAMKNVQNWSNMATTSPFSSTPGSSVSPSKQQDELFARDVAISCPQPFPDDIVPVDNAPRQHVAHPHLFCAEELPCETTEQTAQQPEKEVPTIFQTAQSLFSSGTFSNQIPVPNIKCQPPASTAVHSAGTAICESTVSCDNHATPHVNPPLSGSPVATEGHVRGEGGSVSISQLPSASSEEGLTSSSEPVISPVLPNHDKTKLMPHFESMVDLLQNPTIENQYLVALAKAQLLSSSLSAEGTTTTTDSEGIAASGSAPAATREDPTAAGLQPTPSRLETLAAIAAQVGQNSNLPSLPRGFPGAFETLTGLASQCLADEKPPSLTGLDVVNLLSSSADLTKLLPALAALEMQGGLGLEADENTGLPVPITDPSVIKKVWDEMLCVESNPGYMGALVGDAGVPVRGASAVSAGDNTSLPMKYLNEKGQQLQIGGGKFSKQQYLLGKTSFLLDGNFQLDIPHPNSLEEEESNLVSKVVIWIDFLNTLLFDVSPLPCFHQLPVGCLPSGYNVPLEHESFPTSEEEEEEEEEDEDNDGGDEGDLDGEDSGQIFFFSPFFFSFF